MMLFVLVNAYRDFNIWPDYQKLPVGASAMIYCGTVNTAKWYFGEETLPYMTTSLLISPLTIHNGGVYTCIGKNSLGENVRASSILFVTGTYRSLENIE